ncbi:hypothetical protein C8J56DRAFT_1054995 [Mycena floridula]|nr:hypothetical protein C8J56DRAFT_1054995 [Mycena floridula]
MLYNLGEDEDSTQVLLDLLPDLPDKDMEIPIADRLVDLGGTVTEAYSDYEREDISPVDWVTAPTSFNRVKKDYVAHGNEPSAAYFCGDLCFVVQIPSYESRQ